MAASGELTPLQVQQIWAEVEALRDDTTSHVAQRMMGTGSFGVVERGVRHDFIVRAGPAVKAFTALVAPLHDP